MDPLSVNANLIRLNVHLFSDKGMSPNITYNIPPTPALSLCEDHFPKLLFHFQI